MGLGFHLPIYGSLQWEFFRCFGASLVVFLTSGRKVFFFTENVCSKLALLLAQTNLWRIL